MARPASNGSTNERSKRKGRPLTTGQERVFIGVAFVLAFIVQLAVVFDLSKLLGQ
jgi:hypothetical protein